MRLLIVREDGMIWVTIAREGEGAAAVESREFRRLSHRAWGYIRQKTKRGEQ